MKKVIILSVLALVSLACEQTIDYEIPREEDKITIDAHIVKGEPVKALVGISEYILNAEGAHLTPDATVLLFEDNQQVDTLEWASANMGSQYYESTHLPQSGKTYRVEASHQGMTTAYGEDKVPSAVSITEAEFDGSQQSLKLSFKDPANTEDYYRIRVLSRNHFSGGQELSLSTTDPLIEFFFEYGADILNENDVKSGRQAFLADHGFDGQTRHIEFQEVNYPGSQNDTVLVELTRLSSELYKHQRSKGAHMMNSGNPLSEPVQVYSNIVNGYGIVGAAASSKRVEGSR